MNPQIGDMKVDKILSQFSVKYTNDTNGLIAEKILPRLKVKEKSGFFAKYGDEALRIHKGGIDRAPGTRAVSFEYTVSQGSYNCIEKSREHRIDWGVYKNYDDPYDPKRDATALILENMALHQEYALASVLSDDTIMTNNTTLAGENQWNEADTSTPIDDISESITSVIDETNVIPNTFFCDRQVMMYLKQHPDIREQLKYTSNAMINDMAFFQFIKDFFNLPKIYISTARYNSANEGQDATNVSVWGKHAWVGYTNDKPNLMSNFFGATFTDQDRYVDTYVEKSHKSDVVRVTDSYDQAINDVNMMYLIKNAIA